jgi:hypothetical protein
MMVLLNIVLFFWLQAPAPRVIVGLLDNQQIVVENPQFSGFIKMRDDDAFLMYRQGNHHGELSVKAISRVDFGAYRRGAPFQLTITLRNGQRMEVQSERRDVLMVRGRTDVGTVTIKHPDPLSSVVRIRTTRPNRKDDLTIAYLEFPAS